MLIVYILLGVAAVCAILGVSALIFFKLTVGRRDSWRKPEEKRCGTGEKQALFLYQPSNSGRNVSQAEALTKLLADAGYAVTVNFPSEQLSYDPAQYDLLVFGTPVYMGETAKPLNKYLADHAFAGKRVLLFVNGRNDDAPELEALKLRVPEGNEVHGVKVKAGETQRLLDFAKEHI